MPVCPLCVATVLHAVCLFRQSNTTLYEQGVFRVGQVPPPHVPDAMV